MGVMVQQVGSWGSRAAHGPGAPLIAALASAAGRGHPPV